MATWLTLKKDPPLFQRYFIKEETIRAIRKFFEQRNYHELESPILTDSLPQERYLDILETKIDFSNGSSKTAYLLPSTEKFNKKMLAAGLGNHFVITKVFRALEEISPNHSPEFTMLEWYEVGCDYINLMDSTEELVKEIISHLNNKFKIRNSKSETNSKFQNQNSKLITYQGQTINFSQPWDRFNVRELLEKYSGIKLEDIQDLEKFREIAIAKGHSVNINDDWQTIFEIVFSSEVEPNFSKDKPTFVYDFPRILCPLTKVKESDSLVSEKVEIYIAGKEIGNGYTELTDWEEQEKRFKEEQLEREKLGKKPIAYDQDFVDAIKSGMPEVAGIGIGLDRLVMILADAKSISDINFFPASEWE